MALTLFPTKICLKFASVPVPEAHKYVIPPISYGSPFRSTPPPPPPSPSVFLPFLFLDAIPSPPSPTHGDSRNPLRVFAGVVVARGNIRGNTVNHLSRKKTQCNILGRPGRDATAYVSPLLFPLPPPTPVFFVPLRESPFSRFFEKEGGRGGWIARAISHNPLYREKWFKVVLRALISLRQNRFSRRRMGRKGMDEKGGGRRVLSRLLNENLSHDSTIHGRGRYCPHTPPSPPPPESPQSTNGINACEWFMPRSASRESAAQSAVLRGKNCTMIDLINYPPPWYWVYWVSRWVVSIKRYQGYNIKVYGQWRRNKREKKRGR